MAQFHFVEDYRKHVQYLKANHPLDEAMSLAVGGGFEHVGKLLCEVLEYAGFVDGMTVVDLGCGSGRAAKAISFKKNVNYLGIDVVQELLEYAKSICPKKYEFIINETLSIPADSESADIVFAFSLFTHLLHEESFIYLEDARRVTKPGGKIVFSFLEFARDAHWSVFEATVDQQRTSSRPHLNVFMERPLITAWARHLGLSIETILDGTQGIEADALGQSVAILKKPNLVDPTSSVPR